MLQSGCPLSFFSRTYRGSMSDHASISPGHNGARGVSGIVRESAGDIKLAHSVFALPFALLGAFLARPDGSRWSTFAGQLSLVVVCMVLARTWAMLVNRVLDADLDAQNPRTSSRAIPGGRLSRGQAFGTASACALGFVAVCAGFWVFFENVWPVLLSVPVLVWVGFYSTTKRFTWLCHVFLGGALAASPIAAAIAVSPEYVLSASALWCIAGMVVVWVAGFDVIYALQDVGFDREAGLFSVPSRLGVPAAVWISRVLHGLAVGLLVLAGVSEPRFGVLYWIGVSAVCGVLALEHVVLAKRGEAGLDMAFFTLNGVVSCVLGAFAIADLIAGHTIG